jgi:hypothetical protein
MGRPAVGGKTVKFLMMIKHTEQSPPFEPPKSLMDAMGPLVAEGFKQGWLKDTVGLKGSEHGYRIRSKGGKLTVIDGPFTEAKEIVGGYAIVETATREEAMEIARQFMELHRIHVPDFECEGEVRPLEDSGESCVKGPETRAEEAHEASGARP